MSGTSPRAFLLDLDGTIADSIPIFYEMSCEVFDVAGLVAPDFEMHRAAMAEPGSPIERLFPADFPDREAFFARLYRERWPAWLERYEREARPLPGACEALRSLRDSGASLALVTSSVGSLPFLDHWGIRGLFSAIVGRGDVERIKPDPAPIHAALTLLGVSCEEVLHVGDSPLDVLAGVAAGARTIGVLTGVGREAELRAAGASHVVPSLADLPAALPQFLATNAFGRLRSDR